MAMYPAPVIPGRRASVEPGIWEVVDRDFRVRAKARPGMTR
jgi:hypothetical protein